MKKFLTLTFILLSFAMALSSCAQGETGGSGGGSKLPDGDYIFAKGSSIAVICNTDSSTVENIAGSIRAQTNATISLTNDSAPEAAHEIVIGKTNRAISSAAYRQLARIKEKANTGGEEYVGYVIYSNGNSVLALEVFQIVTYIIRTLKTNFIPTVQQMVLFTKFSSLGHKCKLTL